MWTIGILVSRPIFEKNHREHAWTLRAREHGEAFASDVEVDPNGWVLYRMWERIETTVNGVGMWRCEQYLALCDEGKLIQTYTLNDDEFHSFPTMPVGWTIPF